jgi:hypothetical protein
LRARGLALGLGVGLDLVAHRHRFLPAQVLLLPGQVVALLQVDRIDRIGTHDHRVLARLRRVFVRASSSASEIFTAPGFGVQMSLALPDRLLQRCASSALYAALIALFLSAL